MNFAITLQNAVGDNAIVYYGPLGLTMSFSDGKIVLPHPPECVEKWMGELEKAMEDFLHNSKKQ